MATNRLISLTAMAVAVLSSPATAAVVVYDFSGIGQSTDAALTGTALSGRLTYDTASVPTLSNSGISIYGPVGTISFVSAIGSGTVPVAAQLENQAAERAQFGATDLLTFSAPFTPAGYGNGISSVSLFFQGPPTIFSASNPLPTVLPTGSGMNIGFSIQFTQNGTPASISYNSLIFLPFTFPGDPDTSGGAGSGGSTGSGGSGGGGGGATGGGGSGGGGTGGGGTGGGGTGGGGTGGGGTGGGTGVNGDGAVGAVPEPASWAMMLVGFGAIGHALRRRRRAAVSFSYQSA